MDGKTTTRASMSDTVHVKFGLSRSESSRMVDLVFEEICSALEKGEAVKLTGFGTFKLRDKKPRIGRNPKTLEETVISSRRVLLFIPSSGLKNAVVEGNSVVRNRVVKMPITA